MRYGRARLMAIAIATLGLATVQATGSRAAPDRGTLVCTWGGTPDAPTGVITFSPGITDFPSAGPIEFTATGEIGGSDGCTGRLTFRGLVDPGTSCQVGMPFHATATGFPPIKYVEGNIGAVGTNPVMVVESTTTGGVWPPDGRSGSSCCPPMVTAAATAAFVDA